MKLLLVHQISQVGFATWDLNSATEDELKAIGSSQQPIHALRYCATLTIL